MKQGELRLKDAGEFSRVSADDLRENDKVKLYSEYYEQEFTVEITHSHGDEFGGDVVETSTDDPMIGERDIIHFKPQHVQSIERPGI